MNTPISRLFAVVLVMFAALVYSTTRWTIFDADALNHDNPSQNKRALVRGLTVKRGAIRADDNTVLAGSIKRSDGTYTRRYPDSGLFAHAVGYSFLSVGQAGLEAEYDDDLRGKRSDAETLLDELRGRSNDGDRLVTNLDPAAQRVALQALNGRKGSVVALDPRTGAVKVMASVPSFDPNDVGRKRTFDRLNADNDNAPLLNRATQGGYPPGSTFKVVTAIAAIDSGKYTPESTVNGKSPITISGRPLANDGGEQFGVIDMTDALTHSVNTVWAQVGEDLGGKTMKRYMDRLGFCKELPLDYPSRQIRRSGENIDGCKPPTNGRVDLGRMAIGQDKLNVSPLQMAMVAAAVANGGKLMEPHLGAKIVDPDGRTKETIEPEEYSRVMSADSAAKVGEMMAHVVEEGTGTAAALQGIRVAGKTGTAEIGAVASEDLTQPWFIAFAPVDNPRVAIAATVERTVGGFGGTVAAPIAKVVMETLLREGQ
ncbi:MAG TPA: penicillin-binding transpeptidase domain-containing protein [Solirubrobacteraceae bacterium]